MIVFLIRAFFLRPLVLALARARGKIAKRAAGAAVGVAAVLRFPADLLPSSKYLKRPYYPSYWIFHDSKKRLNIRQIVFSIRLD